MKRFYWTILLLYFFQSASAQYTEIINSKRPGFSESPYGVGSDVYQFEFGLFYNDSNTTTPLAKPNTFGSELFFRFGKIIEKLEVNLNVAYQSDKINNPFPLEGTFKTSGFSDFRIGAKYLIYQQEYTDKSKEIRSWKARHSFDKKRLIPSVGVYLGVMPDLVSESYKKETVSFRAAVLLQNDFSNRLILVTNLLADEIGSVNMIYSYIITLTYTVCRNWSIFAEHVGEFPEITPNEYQLGAGTAYLASPNLQFDASVRTLISNDASDIYASLGVSWRLDKHKDKMGKKDLDLSDSASGKKKSKKGIFSNMFKKNK